MVKKATINQYKYDASHVKHYHLKLNLEIDSDIIEKLSTVESMQGYIKQLIRQDIQKERENKMYRVKPEYVNEFGSDCDIFSVLSYDTLEMISRGWEKPMEEVLEMVYEDNEQNQKKYNTFERVPDFDSISEIMDYELRESVHNDTSPCTEKAFLDEYKKRHKAYYGEEFIY